jgi:ribose transport system substrate-binding protein
MTSGPRIARPAWSRLAIVVATLSLLVSACAAPTAPPSASAGADPSGPAASADAPGASPSTLARFHIGVSNTDVEGWGAALICSIKAQALVSGNVDELTIADRLTDTKGQLADIRNLIAVGVDAIVVNPLDPEALAPAVKEAIDAGVTVVSVRESVPQEGAYLLANDHEAWAFQGANWLFEQMGGKGSVIYMRGKKGDPIDAQRDAGFQRALAGYPDVKIAIETQTGDDQAVAVEQLNAFLATEKKFAGIWTSGVDSVVVDALKIAERPFVPIVGADHGAFVAQLLSEEGLVGAAVTDPAAVGGAGLALALQILGGQTPPAPETIVTPALWDNVTDAGKASLTAANDPDIDLSWPLELQVAPWTTYTSDEMIACEGPAA